MVVRHFDVTNLIILMIAHMGKQQTIIGLKAN